MKLGEQIQKVIDILLDTGDLSATVSNLYTVKAKAEQLEAENAALKRYAVHKGMCSYSTYRGHYGCVCGLDALLAAEKPE